MRTGFDAAVQFTETPYCPPLAPQPFVPVDQRSIIGDASVNFTGVVDGKSLPERYNVLQQMAMEKQTQIAHIVDLIFQLA